MCATIKIGEKQPDNEAVEGTFEKLLASRGTSVYPHVLSCTGRSGMLQGH